mmetsp:Transcript_67518/g.140723  ORF Transcript_67518/g.140723 Transcript_67518/m.140723 type:complete len:393 (+) Transcript_67518:217-1395(+)
MTDEIEEAPPSEKDVHSGSEEEENGGEKGNSKQGSENGSDNENDKKNQDDEAGKAEPSDKEPSTDDKKRLTAEEKRLKKEEDKKKKAEEDKKKKEAKNEDAQKKREEKEAKKQAQAEEKEKKEKEKTIMPKAQLKKICLILVGVLMVYAIVALGISSSAMDRAIKFRETILNDMVEHCKLAGEPPECLSVPELAMAPFYTMLSWSVLLVVACLLSFHGTLRERTGSITSFCSTHVVLMPLQIAFTTLTLVLAAQLKRNSSLVCEEGGEGCSDTDALLEPLKDTLSQLWDYEATQEVLSCEEAEVDQDVVDCFISVFDSASIAVACVLMIPLLVQVPAILFNLRLRHRVIQEQGMDLFAMCRIKHGVGVFMMTFVLFLVLFGVVVAALVPVSP